MEVGASSATQDIISQPNDNEPDFPDQQHQVDVLCCPLSSPVETRSSFSSDSEDEKESLSSSISDSSSEGSGISATDSSDPSSPVTCILRVGRVPPLMKEAKEESAMMSTSSKGETTKEGISTSMDRKRKERHESSFSQEQDSKVIRSTEPETGDNMEDNESRPPLETKETQEIDYVNATVTMPGCEGDKNFGRASYTEVDYGISGMPISIEPEIQRQWERTAAQWQSRKLRKSHRPRRYGRSCKSFSEAEDVIRSNYCNIEELRISNSKLSSTSISHSSQDGELDEEGDYFETLPNSKEDPVRRATLSTVNFSPLLELDLTTLHHQVESEEPISFTQLSSSEQAMLSPRNCVTVAEGIDTIPPSPPNRQLHMDPPLSRQILDGNQESEIQLLSRQVSNWKKQLKVLEGEHIQLFGYKPSHADKLNHREMRKCLLNISRTKQEIKQIREDPSAVLGGTEVISLSPNSRKNLETTVVEIERHMAEDQKTHGRPEDPILMSPSELVLEKGVMQRQLLMLEKRHGRPTTKDEKEIVRKLYDRYRVIKKMSSRFTTVKENTLDLVPILEHEALDLRSEDVGESSRGSGEPKQSPRTHRRIVSRSGPSTASGNVPGEMEPTLRNEDYNDMNLNELERHYKIASEEKRRLRSALRDIKSDVQADASGWQQQKKRGDEKYSTVEGELMHQKYKHTRATLRLLDVLISKRKYPKLLRDVEKIEY